MITQDRYSPLVKLAGFSFPVYTSPGTESRAHTIAVRCERAYRFFQEILNQHNTNLHLLILSPDHWPEFASHPVFGMAHCIDQHTIIVAGQEAEMWKMIVPPMEYFSADIVHALRKVYEQTDGSISIGAFMDLLALHEMMHLFISQATDASDFVPPQLWLIELLCNLGLHAYVANREPTAMEYLTVYPQAIVALGYLHLSHTSLADFEQIYGRMEVPNFAWYQCQLHVAAHHIYDVGGIESMQALFKAIVQSRESFPNEHLAVQLLGNIHPYIAKVLTTWPDLIFP
jgi:hypothetical protein